MFEDKYSDMKRGNKEKRAMSQTLKSEDKNYNVEKKRYRDI